MPISSEYCYSYVPIYYKEIYMTEEDYFRFFELNQLNSIDFNTGTINVLAKTNNQYGNKGSYLVKDIGSLNHDGYQRIWCGSTTEPDYPPKLFMKHRFIYWLKHRTLGTSEKQIDHIDRNRNNNSIDNLRLVTQTINMRNNKAVSNTRGTYALSDILYVCHLLETTSLSDLVIANKVGMSRNYVRDIKKRRRRVKESSKFNWSHRE